MRKQGQIFLLIVLVALLPLASHAQHFSFSEDHDQFHLDVAKGLRSLDIEAVSKIASDFQSQWPRFTKEQKDLIIDIAKIMRARRYQTRPYFSYYFGYISYSVEQANIAPDQLTKVLEINRRLIDKYSMKQLLQFYTDMNFIFGRKSLYRHHYNSLRFENGSYEFDYIEESGEGDFVPIEEEPDSIIVAEEDPFNDFDSDPNDFDSWNAFDSSDPFADSMWDEEKEEEVFGEEKLELAESSFDKVSQLFAEDPPPPITGPIIRFKNVNFEMKTIYDSIWIKNATGTLIIKDRLFVGESGTVEWPGTIRGTDGVKVELEQYKFKTNIPYIKAVKSKLTFNKFFEGQVDGYFLFNSTKRRKLFQEPIYPRFKSHYSDVVLTIPAERLTYVGGIALQGGKMTGESVSGKKSTLTVEDEKGRYFRAQSRKFIFEDSVILAPKSSVAIHHGADSIFHPQLRLNYNYKKSHLLLQEDKGEFKHTYYESTFFKMDFQVDYARWDMKSDSINFGILNAANLVPALFESHDYFHKARLEKLNGVYNFNPLVITLNYSNKIKSKIFYLADMSSYYKIDITMLRGAINLLHQYGYIDFEQTTSQILIKPKAEHYYKSNLKKSDYDNLLISSTNTAKPNATFLLDSGQMKIRGVNRILFTPNQAVYTEPENGEVTLGQGREIKFAGLVKSGDFQYMGRDFTFYYDAFTMDLAQIDSIHIEVPLPDSVTAKMKPGDVKKTVLQNHITETSGTLFINDPINKSGEKLLIQYPYFISSSEAVVYFDRPEILNGAYDKSIKFIVPPFEVDSLDKGNVSGVGFEGTFFSGGIIPPIKQRLSIMPDNSLGFNHEIPAEGYQLYQGDGKLYNKLSLDNKGLHADGKIDFISSEIHSERFTFYMDSVTAIGDGGMVGPGNFANGSYPQVDFEKYKMTWLPQSDSMMISNLDVPLNLYEKQATLDGQIIVTKNGTLGSGKLLTRGSEVVSENYNFSESDYSARNALLKVLSDNPEKPAMQGDDVSIEFDLEKNIAEIVPEEVGVAALSFPYAQMKTSINNAKWLLEDSIITMRKPDNVPIEDSYFFTTRPELDSLAFNATEAIYDINTKELNIKGIPYIIVADAKIIPKGNETTILQDAFLQEFNEAKIVIDTLNEYHHLFDGRIKILSSKLFTGNATYSLTNAAKDSFAIKFEEFKLQEVPRGKKEVKLMTVSAGDIVEQNEVIISAGFMFKGRATMYADLEALQLKGFVKPTFEKRRRNDYWISYNHDAESPEVSIDFDNSVIEDGARLNAGIFMEGVNGNLYMEFLQKPDQFNSSVFFKPSGRLGYNYDLKSYIIETPSKTNGETYAGSTMIYNENTGTVLFEGPVNFIKNTNDFVLESTVIGVSKPDSSKYTVDAMFLIKMNIHKMVSDAMSADVLEAIETLGAPLANNMESNEFFKIANLAGEAVAKSYESKSTKNYVPLISTSVAFDKTLVISNVEMKYSKASNAWYNTSAIGISNLNRNDVNATVDGFFEIKKDQEGADVVNLFIQFSPLSWYYFNFQDNRLLMYSSNSAFNDGVTANATIAKVGIGQFGTGLGEQQEVLRFINEFRKTHFGITKPYDLQSPDDTFLEDESFETIEKKKDGFGF